MPKLEVSSNEYMVMAHIPYPQAFPMLNGLYALCRLDGFDVSIQAPHARCSVGQQTTVPTYLRIDFYNRNRTPDHVSFLKELIRHLQMWAKYGVVVKYGERGYVVNGQMDILEEWSLDDSMS